MIALESTHPAPEEPTRDHAALMVSTVEAAHLAALDHHGLTRAEGQAVRGLVNMVMDTMVGMAGPCLTRVRAANTPQVRAKAMQAAAEVCVAMTQQIALAIGAGAGRLVTDGGAK